MSRKAESFEHWIRTSFVQMNTELENLYFANKDRAQVIGCGDPIKALLRDEGHTHVVALLAEGNTGEGFDSAYGVLGSVGLYLGALRRHCKRQLVLSPQWSVGEAPNQWRCIQILHDGDAKFAQV